VPSDDNLLLATAERSERRHRSMSRMINFSPFLVLCREEWDAVNKRAEEFASIMCRIADAKAAVEREGLLEADKKDMAAKLQSRANQRLRDAAMLGLDAQVTAHENTFEHPGNCIIPGHITA
jgi:uncharacterized protein YdaU (DUF1376 family)